MTSHISKSFREMLNNLPTQAQHQARTAFAKWKEDHWHPSLRFRQVHPSRPFYSARINDDWRAVGYVQNDEINWFWIGSHSDYNNLLKQL